MRSLFFLLLFISSSAFAQELPRAEPYEIGMSPERLARLDTVMQQYVNNGRLPGAVLLVARDGFVVYEKAFGYRDVETKARLREDDLFRIASQTKALVSVGIMMLQERGNLLITDPVSKYLPEFARTTVAVPKEGGSYDVVPAKRAITLRDLLTHTAGLGYGWGPAQDRWEEAGIQGWYFADRDEPIAATISRMAALPMDAQPGDDYVYGYATDVLGVVIEKVSGKSLADFIRTEITEPLAMKDTFFYVPEEDAERLSTVYSVRDGKLVRSPEGAGMEAQGNYLRGPRKSYSGGAGLVSTAADFARFLEMMRRGGELDGVQILSPKTVQLMTVDHLDAVPGNDGRSFGLGFSVEENLGDGGLPGSIGEFGWGGAYHSTYWVDPAENLVVAYFTQVIPATGLDDHARIRALIYASLIE